MPTPTAARPRLDDTLRRLIEALNPKPAYVVTPWWNLLAYRAYGILAGDLDRVPETERNIVWLMFTDPAMQRLFCNWDDEAARLVGQLRTNLAAFPDDQRGQHLLHSLLGADSGFATLWHANRVLGFQTARKTMQHRTAGRVELDYVKLDATTRDQHVIVFLPADQDSAAGLNRLTLEA